MFLIKHPLMIEHTWLTAFFYTHSTANGETNSAS